MDQSTVAPLIPLLRRWSSVEAARDDPCSKDNADEDYASSPSACLLRQAALSAESMDGDKDIDVDLYQAAVLVLAHLDRLAVPHLQSQTSVGVSCTVLHFFQRFLGLFSF